MTWYPISLRRQSSALPSKDNLARPPRSTLARSIPPQLPACYRRGTQCQRRHRAPELLMQQACAGQA
eukprot:4510472-Pyramimonas_sp.AAC.1